MTQEPAPRPVTYRSVIGDPRLAPLWYTLARLGLLLVAGAICYAFGARSLLLVALAFLISGLASIPLLSRQRGMMSAGIVRIAERINKRIDDATTAEDDD